MGRLINTLFALRAVIGAALVGVSGAALAASPEELQAWRAAQQAGTVEAYQAFLELFPDGEFADEAFAALADSYATAVGGTAVETPQVDTAPASSAVSERTGGDERGPY